MTESRFAADVFFDAWCDHTRHLTRMLPITEAERSRGTSFPARALEAAVRDAHAYLHLILGHAPDEATRACAEFAAVTVEWTRTDGRDRAVLRRLLRQEEALRRAAAPEQQTSPPDPSDHPWLTDLAGVVTAPGEEFP